MDHEPCQFDEVRSDEGSENKDELVVSPEEASNRNEESQAEEYQGKQAETILEKNESKRASDLGGTQPETREEKEKTLVEKTYQETLSNTEEDSPVMALADQPQDCSPQINDQILLNQKEDESVVDWDPVRRVKTLFLRQQICKKMMLKWPKSKENLKKITTFKAKCFCLPKIDIPSLLI